MKSKKDELLLTYKKMQKPMKKLLSIIVIGTIMFSCGDKPAEKSAEEGATYESHEAADPKPDDGKGVGQVTQVTLNTPLEQDRIGRGKAIYEMKCQACHKLDDVRVVGPGWKDVTKKRKPEWIMNM